MTKDKTTFVFITFSGGAYQFSINDKILDQIDGLSSLGRNCELLVIDDEVRVYRPRSKVKDLIGFSSCAKRSLISRFRQIIIAIQFIKNRNKNNDVIYYVRHPSFGELPLLLFSKRRKKIVLEVNGIFKNEFEKKDAKTVLKLTAETLLTKIAFRKANAIVSVTNEIDEWISKSVKSDTKRVVMTNGVKIDRYSLRAPVKCNDGIYKILAVANFNCWHGYDRILKAIIKNEMESRFQIKFIGAGPELKKLMKLVDDNDIKNVEFIEPRKGSDLDSFYDHSDIALGVMAIERKGLREMCPLKHREYCARGIPFIMSGVDIDFPQDVRFVLNLPPGDIDINSVVEFIENMRKWDEHPKVMRRFAEEHLAWNVKMMNIENLIREIEYEN